MSPSLGSNIPSQVFTSQFPLCITPTFLLGLMLILTPSRTSAMIGRHSFQCPSTRALACVQSLYDKTLSSIFTTVEGLECFIIWREHILPGDLG